MIASGESASHEEAWLALPWLANGRLSQAERDKLEPHVRTCAGCREELAFQRLLCNVLTEPDRVTYAPGPSFRKLMDRIDASEPQTQKVRESTKAPVTPIRRRSDNNVALWRPPGLAWAASFILAMGLGGVITTVYHWSDARYITYTDPPRPPDTVPNVRHIHISFNRSVTIDEAEAALRSNGARVVEGPDSSGILGVAPSAEQTNQALRLLSARLRADPRVRWVEPVPGDNTSLPPSRGP
jgi:Putative zinc-finger